MDAGEDTRLRLDFEYHFTDYHAEANWNLRDDWAHPVSFVHDTRATGVVAALELNRKLSERWSFVARVESQRFVGEPGTDIINSIDSYTGAIEQLSARLNAVMWQSLAANVGVTLRVCRPRYVSPATQAKIASISGPSYLICLTLAFTRRRVPRGARCLLLSLFFPRASLILVAVGLLFLAALR